MASCGPPSGSWTGRRSQIPSIRPQSSWRCSGSRHVGRWQHERSPQLGGCNRPALTSLDCFMREASYRDGMRVMLPLMPAILALGAFRGGPLRRLLEAQLLVDESWALSSRDGGFDRRLLLGAGGILYVGWNAGTAIGVLAGDTLTNPATLGLDAAFPALFLALLAPLLRTADRAPLAAALAGAGIALVLTPITPAGIPVIAATAACLVGLTRPRNAVASERPDGERQPPRLAEEASS